MSDSDLDPILLEWGSPQARALFAYNLREQSQLLRRIDYKRLDERLFECWPLVDGALADASASSLLAVNGLPNQSVVILRAFIERLVTFYYLEVASAEARKAYFQYSVQKTYRLAHRTLSVQGKKRIELKFSGEIDLSQHPELDEAVKRFTGPAGKVQTRWSNTSVENKLGPVIDAGIVKTSSLEMLLFSVYDNASEALHATIYGCFFHLGAFQPGWKPMPHKEMLKEGAREIVINLWLACECLHDLLKYLLSHQLERQPESDEILQESKFRTDALTTYIKSFVASGETK